MMTTDYERIRARLARDATNGTAAQSYVFVDCEGSGALAAAREFLAARLAAGRMLPAIALAVDIMVLEPKREIVKGIAKERDIPIEDVRAALHFLGSAPFSSFGKALLVRDAHRLTEASQNALLKTLEEPPAYATIVLVTRETDAMLPTVLSRACVIAFPSKSSVDEAQDELLKEFERWETLSPRERLALTERAATDRVAMERVLETWLGIMHARMLEERDAFRQGELLRHLAILETLLRDMKRFPSSVRLLLDNFSAHWS
jgi:hypothetical protein